MNDDSKAKQKQRFSKIVSVKSQMPGHASALTSHRESAIDSMQVSVRGCVLVNFITKTVDRQERIAQRP